MSFDLEYVEQPCESLVECAALRTVSDVPVAVDEGLRKAADPHHVVGLREAADILVLEGRAAWGSASGDVGRADLRAAVRRVVRSRQLRGALGGACAGGGAARPAGTPAGWARGSWLIADVTHDPVGARRRLSCRCGRRRPSQTP